MKTASLLAFCLIVATPTLARPHVYSDKQFAEARKAVADALLALSVDDSEWSIFVIPEKDWKATLQHRESGHTAFTLLPHKLTYINAKWIENIQGDPLQIAPILAHEYGHILCGCSDEGLAEGYVSILFHRR